MESISVIICTFNPRREVFSRCLHAIKEATMLQEVKEVIIVDNNSSPALAETDYIREYLAEGFKVVVEEKQGLTPARLRGIKESSGELLVFVDDDNFIKPDFLLKGFEIAKAYPFIGSFSGQVRLIFETPPPEWTYRYHGMLVQREFESDIWSNLPNMPVTMPCGAGLFVRTAVAGHYRSLHELGKRNIQLDRTGNSLFSGGDNDLAACACDIGSGVGLFHELKLDHFIPAARLEKRYLLKLAKGIAASSVVFRSFRNEMPEPMTPKRVLANRLRMLTMPRLEREFFRANAEGEDEGRRILQLQDKTD
jgi:glycosyltransferase involved in cell wall biosynthesis